MARTRNRIRFSGSGIGVDDDGNIVGILDPAPFVIKDFNEVWKHWLNNFAKSYSLTVGTNWLNLTAVSTSVDGATYSVLPSAQVILADPDSGALRIDLIEGVEDGLSVFIKNTDESGTYALTINPGSGTKIDGQPAGAAPASADVTLSPLDSYHLVYDSEEVTWWII